VTEQQGTHVVVLSAASEGQLAALAERLQRRLAGPDPAGAGPHPAGTTLARVAYTTQTGRVALSHRLAVTAAGLPELCAALGAFVRGQEHPAVRRATVDPPAAREPASPPTEAEAAAAWLAGLTIDWARYWPEPPGRISLPTYPFAAPQPPPAPQPHPAPQPPPAPQPRPEAVTRAGQYLRRLYAEISGIPEPSLHLRVPLDQYGLNSYLVTQLNERLARDLGEVPRTLFFRHPDLGAVAEDLAVRFPAKWDGTASARPAPPDARITIPAGTPGSAQASAPADAGPGRDAGHDIAVIGIAGRYPQAPDLGRFWDNLAGGVDSVTRLPPSRRRAGWPSDLMWGGFLDQVDRFDPALFGITPRDASLMDPQERLFLQVAWESFDDAGYPRTRLREQHRSRVAVYAGAMYNEYPFFGVEQALAGHPQDAGSAIGGIANRVSYHFDLKGPSLTVDTMCSSSLVAIHLAVRSLRMGEAEVAIAGAVNLSLHPNKFRQQARMRLTASDHRCRSFGARGDGFVPAEGVGAVVLKPLRAALADGDRIHAVIRGTGVLHCGKTNGWIVPSPVAQADVVRAALRDADIPADSIGYLEAHGTGTALGDPVEVDGLLGVFGELGLAPGAIPIGSAKSAIGHAEAAAGIASLTKVILQMRHRKLAPSLHADELNPGIAWDRVPFRVQRTLDDWPAPDGGPRRAGISSFGAGGTIAHVIVESPETLPVIPPGPPSRGPQVIVLSAHNENRLHEVARGLAGHLDRAGSGLSDIAYTLQVGREPLRERLAVVVGDAAELRRQLRLFLEGRPGAVLRGRAVAACDAGPQPADPEALARRWVGGGQVDWRRHWDAERAAGRPPSLVSLPSYPFAEVRCWLPEAPAQPSQQAPQPEAGQPEAAQPEAGLYRKDWRPGAEAPRAGIPDGAIACLYRPEAAELVSELSRLTGPGTLLPVPADGLADPLAGAELLAGLLRRRPDLRGWLDLCDLGPAEENPDAWTARLAMLQRLLIARAGESLRVLHVTRGLQAVPGPDPSLAGAQLAGFVRMLGAEYQHVTSTTMDVDAPLGSAELAAQIAGELAAGAPCGEICYRGGRRLEPYLVRADEPRQAVTFDPAAAYVITGGTRGLGARLARHLADHGVRKLALTGLAPVPPRAAWDGELTEAEAEAVVGLRALEERGARVLVHHGSLARRDELAVFLGRVRGEFGRIAGVVHCAGRGELGRPALAHKEIDEIRAVLEPKVDGLLALAELTEADDLRFFVAYSSICAIVPRLASGVAEYAAANSFLDFFVQHRNRLGQPRFRAVCWPTWRDSGSGRGQADPCAGYGIASLSDAAGLRVFERAAALPGGGTVLPIQPLGEQEPDLAGLLRVKRPQPRSSAPAAPAAQVPAPWLVTVFCDVLGTNPDDLDPDTEFGDLGVESVMLGELLERIEDHLDRRLEPGTLLDHPTLRRLQAFLGPAADTVPPPAEPGPSPAEPGPSPAEPGPSPAEPGPSAEPSPSPAGPAHAPDRRVAIIGMACRFPGAEHTGAFWASLQAGRSPVTEVPASRWDHRRWYRPEGGAGWCASKWGAFIDGIEDFDPGYFKMSAEEGTHLDPAVRLFLEATATALHDAGYAPAGLAGREIGVFAGGRVSSYVRRAGLRPGLLHSDPNFLGAHVAHCFDFRGPNMVVDTACSSSLVSVQLACQSLLAGESELAIAGGVEVLLDEQPYLEFSTARVLSPTGRCATFDESADGFVPGEGVGVVVLKPLAAALADGDPVHAVIESVAVNSDGRTMGITTPNPVCQAQVVRRALAAAGRSAGDIGMIEAHGTGTLIGDPIELRALTEVFRETSARVGDCAIGSVKSNIGHLLAAAGVAGLLKAVLAVKHGQIPPTLRCENPNPRFDFGSSPFYVSAALHDWPAGHRERVAGVSSFGLGGTNAHAILSALTPAARGGHRPPRPSLPPPAFHRQRLWLPPVPVDPPQETPSSSSLLQLTFR
jgi:acyl transferase domain-containing protein/acyl carrier protein/NADP-dependent 3-hydroxy acid dehydrogenase YdfG